MVGKQKGEELRGKEEGEMRVKEEKRKNITTLRDCGRVGKRGTEERQAEGGRQN